MNTIFPYFEAIKLLRDWSVILLFVQTAIFISLVSAYFFSEKLQKDQLWLKMSLTFWALSIIIALNVIGTIPWSTQKLPNLISQYQNIYQFQNYIGIPIWMLAFTQHIFFLFGIISLMIFIYISGEKKTSKNKQVQSAS